MNRMKKYLLTLPEIVLLGLTFYWLLDNYFGANHFNFIAFTVFVVLLSQVFFRNKYVGLTMATLTGLFSLYMVLAVVSEFGEFPTLTSEAFQLLGFGLLFCFLGVSSSMLMFYKYLLPKVF